MDDFELQQRIKNAVSGAQPDSAQLWENVMEESTHARNVRNAKRTALTLTVFAFAIAVPVAVGLLGSDDGDIVGPGGSPGPVDTTTSASPSPADDVYRTYVDTQLNFIFDIPGGWRITEFEGHRIVAPKNAKSSPEDGPVTQLQIAAGDLAPAEGRTSTTFRKMPAEEIEGDMVHWLVVDWPASPLCPPCEDGPISIWWEATNSDDWTAAQPSFEMISLTLQPLYYADGTFTEQIGAELWTRRGMANIKVPLTKDVAAAIDFLDRRMMLDDLTPVLSETGKEAYDDLVISDGNDEEPRLAPELWWPRTYVIEEANLVDANSTEIFAEIRYDRQYSEDDMGHDRFYEDIFVGQGTSISGRSGSVIRGAQDHEFSTPSSTCELDPDTRECR